MRQTTQQILNLPTPLSLSYLWNGGSLLGACLGAQILTGLLLSMHYTPEATMAFNSVVHIMRDEGAGWALRFAHANGASLFFMVMYTHMGRSLYYGSYTSKSATWLAGVAMYLAVMATAFLGYVLPWGQMSLWGATVITNLVSSIPYIGGAAVEWVWGGFSVSNATLNRFYTLHFILPFLVLVMTLGHLATLHKGGSSSPLGATDHLNKVPFHPLYSYKDIVGFGLLFALLVFLTYFAPYSMMDVENSLEANSLVTPVHIQPEWYFLFAYAILRSIPSKLGGVVALACALLALFLLPLKTSAPLPKIFWCFVVTFLLLTWLGACPIESPYTLLSQVLSVVYFLLLLVFSEGGEPF